MKQKPYCNLCTNAVLREKELELLGKPELLKYKLIKKKPMTKEFEDDKYIDFKCNNIVRIRYRAGTIKTNGRTNRKSIIWKWVEESCDCHKLLIKGDVKF